MVEYLRRNTIYQGVLLLKYMKHIKNWTDTHKLTNTQPKMEHQDIEIEISPVSFPDVSVSCHACSSEPV